MQNRLFKVQRIRKFYAMLLEISTNKSRNFAGKITSDDTPNSAKGRPLYTMQLDILLFFLRGFN